jgi:DNA-binding response OmpR family regulator
MQQPRARMSLRALVVDDEPGVRFFLEETLRRAGHSVVSAANGEEALTRLRETRFDLLLLDLKLGGRVDGLRVLESVKWRWPGTLVIVLTAHGSLDSAVEAIQEGVDGYLLKPVEPAEVRQAIQTAVERRERLAGARQAEPEQDLLTRGSFSVDLKKHTATYQGQDLELTPREFALLVHLMENAPRVISPKELVLVVRDFEPAHMHEAREILKWYIHRLRQKVEPDPSEPRYIVNVRGVGYRFAE